jgi:uncharacterized protein YdaU (DUF1376 family)
MFYYKHHIGDYRRDTGHLSLLEHGAYRQLLDLYYVDEKPIPNETDWVMRRLSAKTQVEKDAVLAVLSDFFTQNEAGWSHKRCDSEILAYEEKADQNQKNGKLGGRPKKKAEINPEITQSVSNANPTQSENNLNHKPLTINHKPLTKEPFRESGAKAPRAARKCPDDFLVTDAMKTWAAAECPNADIHAETLKFRDYTFSTVRTDWAGTWRNWLRKSQESKPFYGKSLGHVNKQEALEASNRAVVERLLEKEAKYA